ncbi:MAG: hypothetical protein JWP31_1097 [Aeromicrobium sp.]|nr:hypothetical protein [Aeromicrobium sp.]
MRRLRSTSSPWSVLIFRLTGRGTQQQILRALRDAKRPGLIALGAERDDGCFVVIECPSVSAEDLARRTVGAIDAWAECLTTTRSSEPLALVWSS